jgi:hypothetical protein
MSHLASLLEMLLMIAQKITEAEKPIRKLIVTKPSSSVAYVTFVNLFKH